METSPFGLILDGESSSATAPDSRPTESAIHNQVLFGRGGSSNHGLVSKAACPTAFSQVFRASGEPRLVAEVEISFRLRSDTSPRLSFCGQGAKVNVHSTIVHFFGGIFGLQIPLVAVLEE